VSRAIIHPTRLPEDVKQRRGGDSSTKPNPLRYRLKNVSLVRRVRVTLAASLRGKPSRRWPSIFIADFPQRSEADGTIPRDGPPALEQGSANFMIWPQTVNVFAPA